MNAMGGAGRLGNLVVRLKVTVPRSLTARQRELLTEFSQEEAARSQRREQPFARSSGAR